MDRPHSKPLTENELHALVDGQLPADALAALRERLARDPQAQATQARWQQQRTLLQGLHRDALAEPLPPALLAAAHQSSAVQQRVQQGLRLGGLAASVLLAFGVGWFSHTAWLARLPSPALAQSAPVQEFARQARVAHAVYSPETRHPVEVAAAEQAHLVQWLSKRVGKLLKVPYLGTLGYELVGGRLLPGEAGARAQFMFQNAAGTRITLYLGLVDKAGTGLSTRETGFHFAGEGPLPSFYWVDKGFGYALTGPMPRDTLLQLAEAVYRQL